MRKTTATLLAAAIALGACQQPQNGQNRDCGDSYMSFDTTGIGNTSIHMETQPVDSGYGYVIAVNGKKMIAQTVIPVVEGNHQFPTPQAAYAIGRTAARKMATSTGFPSITMDDLIENNIVDRDGKIK